MILASGRSILRGMSDRGICFSSSGCPICRIGEFRQDDLSIARSDAGPTLAVLPI